MSKAETVATEFEKVIGWPVKALKPSPFNPRTFYDPAAMRDLIESVKAHGIKIPLIVRVLKEDQAEVVTGHRRLRAAVDVKLAEVPVIIRQITDREALEYQLTDTAQNLHPLDEAAGFKKLMEMTGTAEETAALCGKTRQHVVRSLQLLNLTKNIQKMFFDGKIDERGAFLLSRIAPADQTEAVEESTESDGSVVNSELRDWIENNVMLNLSGAPWKKDDVALVPAAGPCTICPKRTGFEPELFPDIKAKNLCLDRKCFQGKMDAHIDAKKAEIKAAAAASGSSVAKYEPAEISTSYAETHVDKKERRPGVLYSQQYRVVEKGKPSCIDTKPAVMVDGNDAGHEKKICTNPKCTIHGGRHGQRSETSPAEKAKRAHDRQEQLKNGAIRNALIGAAVEKVGKSGIGTTELRVIAHAIFDRMLFDDCKALCQYRALEPPKAQYGGWDYRAAPRKGFDDWNALELAQRTIEAALIQIPVERYGSGLTLRKATAELGVNVKKIEKDVTASMAERKGATKKAVATKAAEIVHALHTGKGKVKVNKKGQARLEKKGKARA